VDTFIWWLHPLWIVIVMFVNAMIGWL